jgi:hypothetical protein
MRIAGTDSTSCVVKRASSPCGENSRLLSQLRCARVPFIDVTMIDVAFPLRDAQRRDDVGLKTAAL